MRASLGGGSFPSSVVTGDFNQDGHLDFAMCNGASNDIWIYLGKGDGTFQLPRIVPLTKGQTPAYMAAVDLRGVGKLDLIVAEFDSSTVGVLLGKGDGTFDIEQTYTLPEPPGALTVGDFNHDGKLDVTAVMYTETDPGSTNVPYIAMLAGAGDGSLASPVITYNVGYYSQVANVDSADVNGDGVPDLLITGPDLDNSTIYLGSADGTFTKGPVILGVSAFDIPLDGRLVDVNGDGCPDAEVADVATLVWVSLNDCSGNFGALTPIPMGQGNAALRVVDINGDGHPDLVAAAEITGQISGAETAGNTISVAYGDGKGGFGSAHVYQGNSEALALAVGDFAANGKPSVVTADIDTDTATVYTNLGGGDLGFPQGLSSELLLDGHSYFGYSGLSFADVNGDGKPDIYVVGAAGDGYDFASMAYLNDGAGHFKAPIVSPAGTGTSIEILGDYRLGDFRKSGHLDLLAIGGNTAFEPSSQVIFFQPGNGDGSFGKAVEVTTTGADGQMAVADFNGDGKLDFVTINGSQTHTLTPFLGNGDGTFHAGTAVTFSDTNDSIGRVYATDLNRDGKMDVLLFDTANGYWTTGSAVWEFLGNGDGTFGAGKELYTGFQPMTMDDLNNDGHLDIARYDFFWPDGETETFGPVKFTNYLGQADGSFVESSSYTSYTGTAESTKPYEQFGDPAASSITGDFNGDGKVDEVAYESGLPYFNYAQILMGNGDGTFTPTYNDYGFSYSYYPVYGADLNGDGKKDLVTVDYGGSSMVITRGAAAAALQLVLDTPVVIGQTGCGTIYPDVISASDRTASLATSIAGITLPGSVTVRAKAGSAHFCFTLTSAYDWHQVYDIRATLDGSTAIAYGSQSYVYGYDLAISPASTQAVYAGQKTAPITVTLTSQPGYSGTVQLSCGGLPAGYLCEFSPATVAIAPGAPGTATLVVDTTTTIPSIPVSLNVTANDGNVVRQQLLQVYVTNLALSSSQNQPGIPLEPGGTATTQFDVTGIPPYTFACTGLPAGATCSFSGAQAQYPSPSSITLSVNAASSLALGNYTFQVTAKSGGQSAAASETLELFTFSVGAPAAESDWALPGSSGTITLPVSYQNLPGETPVIVSCTLDGTAICPVGTSGFGLGTNSISSAYTIPASFAVGLHQLVVGTNVYGIAQSFQFPFYVADYSGSLSKSLMVLSAGSSQQVTATIQGTAGYDGTVAVSCSAPSGVQCSVSPAYATVTHSVAADFAVTVTAGTTPAVRAADARHSFRHSGYAQLAWLSPFTLLLYRKRRRWGKMLCLVGCAALLGTLASCGGSGSGGGGGGGTHSATYQVTVSAVANNTATVTSVGTISVTVNY
jgi:hypothetical protein